MYEKPKFLFCGDTALTIEIDNTINPETNDKIISLCDFIESENISGIYETLPTYCSLTVFYNPLNFDMNKFISFIEERFDQTTYKENLKEKVIEIPVIYGGDYGPDLIRVCEHNTLTPNEVIKIHCQQKYLVYMLGFTPGFPYLGGMNDKISTPRLDVPRKTITSGSVGIAGNQTGIYPVESPGGWNIIGQTPFQLFNPNLDSPTLLKAGDYIKFKPIDEKTYLQMKGAN